MGYPTQSAMGRRRDMGSEALEKCYNVHHGLLRRLRVVVVVDNNSTIDLRQKPYQIANFGEGIEIHKEFFSSLNSKAKQTAKRSTPHAGAPEVKSEGNAIRCIALRL
jgi:hypothetical protein